MIYHSHRYLNGLHLANCTCEGLDARAIDREPALRGDRLVNTSRGSYYTGVPPSVGSLADMKGVMLEGVL